MAGLDDTILVRNTRIVAGSRHAVMRAQRLVAPGPIFCGVTIQIAERCREAVAAVFAWRTSERPQCVLQPFGQCDEALTAEHHLGMLPAAESPAAPADAPGGRSRRVPGHAAPAKSGPAAPASVASQRGSRDGDAASRS
jgi:hypothetical protein